MKLLMPSQGHRTLVGKRYTLDIAAADVKVALGVLGRFHVWLFVPPSVARRIAAALNKAADEAEENAQ